MAQEINQSFQSLKNILHKDSNGLEKQDREKAEECFEFLSESLFENENLKDEDVHGGDKIGYLKYQYYDLKCLFYEKIGKKHDAKQNKNSMAAYKKFQMTKNKNMEKELNGLCEIEMKVLEKCFNKVSFDIIKDKLEEIKRIKQEDYLLMEPLKEEILSIIDSFLNENLADTSENEADSEHIENHYSDILKIQEKINRIFYVQKMTMIRKMMIPPSSVEVLFDNVPLTREMISKHYRKLAVELHPDKRNLYFDPADLSDVNSFYLEISDIKKNLSKILK